MGNKIAKQVFDIEGTVTVNDILNKVEKIGYKGTIRKEGEV